MNTSNVIACFVIYSGENIAYQGTFQVMEEVCLYSHQSTDSGVFGFQHFYEGAQCHIKLTYSKGESIKTQVDIKARINRSKIKWKEVALGDMHRVYYRCALDFPEHSKELRKILRRSAIARRDQMLEPNFHSISNLDYDEDA